MIECQPNPMPSAVTTAISRWEAAEKSRVFLFICSDASHLSRAMVDRVYHEECRGSHHKRVDVVLDSSGGSIEAAFQLVTALRTSCDEMRVFVPDWAKSAAAFFCLGADEVWMSCTAELGPLDAQIRDPRDPNEFISALEEFRAIDYLRTLSFEILDESVALFIRRTNMRLKDVISEGRHFATGLAQPLYGQVDPIIFGSAHRALDMAMEYGKRVMSRYAYSSWSADQIEALLKQLTWNYPSHSFVIDHVEAASLGLNVQLLDGTREADAQFIISNLSKAIGFPELPARPAPRTRKKTVRNKRATKNGRRRRSEARAVVAQEA